MTASDELPPAVEQLLRNAPFGQIATLMPDGSPQVTQVWVDTDGRNVIVNSVVTHQKVRNVRRDPRVAINAHDPTRPYRVVNIRGIVVDISVVDAELHIDMLSQRYLGVDRYPYHHPDRPRIVLKIQPRRIHTQGLD